MNKHISSCRLGGSSDKFGNTVFFCIGNKKKGSYFQILSFMKLVGNIIRYFMKKYFTVEAMLHSTNSVAKALLKPHTHVFVKTYRKNHYCF